MEPMLNVALSAARKAGQIIERAIDRLDKVTVESKSRNDFVTQIDKASEKEIIYQLQKAYPQHKILAEETGLHGDEESEYEWVIDPLDGTTNFIHGIPHFAVSIACLHKKRLTHAVVYDPIKREEFTASRGQGAHLNGRRIRLSNLHSFDGALFGTGIPFSGYALDHMDGYLKCLHEISKQCAGIRRAGAAALDLAYVAAGRFDGFWELGLKPWDIAAGALLITEAGGLVADFNGGNAFLEKGNVVAANPKLLKLLLPIVQKHLGYL